ncbi:ferric-chelate reductase 1 [Elysia marginata]|uniref:Ferric-chelate reductase 1 n=1 Tax=Elysia marginata TaxID=1093978 RepID=A0AAV4J5H0_9GAST|nr:ferric-chelate reductase 1 [Elysia marginata]
MNAAQLLSSIFYAVVLMGSLVSSYPTGAPAGACTSLNPDSHGPSTAKGPSPYEITFSPTTYQPGQNIKVTLSGAQFKGFLIVGRKAEDTSMTNVGFFQTPTTPAAQLQCTTGKEGNGVTHTNNTVKSSITLDWKAPSSAVGDIVFHFTTVRGGAPSVKVNPSDYYMDQKSSPLKSASDEVLRFEKEVDDINVLETSEEEDEEIVYTVPSYK